MKITVRYDFIKTRSKARPTGFGFHTPQIDVDVMIDIGGPEHRQIMFMGMGLCLWLEDELL